MTINEFCKMYHVSHQAVYSAIRRHNEEMKDHISKNSAGIKLLDDYAVEFLKPTNVSQEKYIAVCEENDKLRVQNIAITMDNEDLQKRISELENQMLKEKAAIEGFSSKYSQLSQEKDKRISEMEKRISDITALLDEKDSRISDLEREISSLRELCDSQKSAISELKQRCLEQEESLSAAKGNKGIFGLGKR